MITAIQTLQMLVCLPYRKDVIMISWCWNITTKGIAALGKGCPYLEDLKMIQLASVDDEGMNICKNKYVYICAFEGVAVNGNRK
jgi:hypothetical protein